MPTLEVFDTVVLERNRLLVGIVERVHHENNGALDDILIIAHVPVDSDALNEFMTTGSPPKNYVFVKFANEAHGSSLVHENDVILLDRSFAIGDVVKHGEGHMSGTVTSLAEHFILQPVWVPASRSADISAVPFDEESSNIVHTCDPGCPFGILPEIGLVSQAHLLHNIPAEELEAAEDFVEGDYILQGDFLGVVDSIEQLVIVLLENHSIVVVRDAEQLYIPVEDDGKPLVLLPEFDDLARPDPLIALQGWPSTIPLLERRCGKLVITDPRNLRMGRWLRGQYDHNVKPQGRILDVKSKRLYVKWLACNAFIPKTTLNIKEPPKRISAYENINTFSKGSELRSNKNISVYDRSRFPRTSESRVRCQEMHDPILPTVHSSGHLRVGDQAKFRDQAGAALKYLGTLSTAGVLHGKFDKIAPATTFGFDVNKFQIVGTQQEATVLWHDGSSSSHLSTTLHKFALFETQLAPADLVVSREELKQAEEDLLDTDIPPESLMDFNEMKLFENPHCLIPKRVGVVQNVNQSHRIAQVRWFEEPKICIGSSGHVLSADSRFGKLSVTVEDVSLYEIMTFPVLTRRLKDLTMIPPDVISSETVEILKGRLERPQADRIAGFTSISHINHSGGSGLLVWLQFNARAAMKDSTPPSVLENGSYELRPSHSWVGELVSISLDGSVTVRVSTRDFCKDVRLEHDQLLCLIDDGTIEGQGTHTGAAGMFGDTDMDVDELDDFDTVSTISETVEYEGGERLDSDSGDENWEDAHDDEEMQDEDEVTSELVDAKATPIASTETATPSVTAAETYQTSQSRFHEDVGIVEKVVAKAGQEASRSDSTPSLSSLRVNLPTSEPPPFLILEQPPPLNQYQASGEEPLSAATFLKRVAKEHRILSSSLPRGEIFVRTYETRLDLMRCLIIGPPDTPYEYAPFLIDLHLTKKFPKEPPVAYFHSWTSGFGRINPNLYEEGKICLSLLGTWPGRGETEGWSEDATILQVLISLQALVLVRHPFYNEAGFEDYTNDKSYDIEAQRYSEKVYVMARGFVKHALTVPINGLEDVLAWIYLPHGGQQGLLETVISRSNHLIQSSEKENPSQALVDGNGSGADQTKVFLKPLSRGAIVMLRKTIWLLESLIQPKSEEATGTGMMLDASGQCP